ncbi:MerR family transcriptional regulator [Thalassospira sp. TSL5-1]|uniref:MerR family transcriptional regulator n=1 Tax=Thalassospira sp. TSL5-1 TaxID=1544451 RepID=UPI0009FA7A2B|nr:MerR family transcriptional regulator [Thalassospira sp. TSL5-1]
MKNELGETAKNRRTMKSDSAFRTISEAATELGLQQHVLRFWEQKFPQIKPMKRAGGRRYYRPDDIEFLKGIRALLHDQGYTIKGVQKLIAQNGGTLPGGAIQPASKDASVADSETVSYAESVSDDAIDVVSDSSKKAIDRQSLMNVLGELEGLQSLLRATLQEVKKNP